MPFVRSLKTFSYVSDNKPLVEVEVTFSQTNLSKTVVFTKKQIDKTLNQTKSIIQVKPAVNSDLSTSFYFSYHISPDNETAVIVADLPFPDDWWKLLTR
jgi:hypothetical protein